MTAVAPASHEIVEATPRQRLTPGRDIKGCASLIAVAPEELVQRVREAA
jgi:hypothetical protein